jgi:phosphoribosyl-ATP pyrophosphohydrolase
MMTDPLDRLYEIIASKEGGDPSTSYTAKLLAKGRLHCAKKMGEEAVETALAAVGEDKQALVAESADLLYHLLVLWAASGVTPDDVYQALASREGRSGIEEKASRKT